MRERIYLEMTEPLQAPLGSFPFLSVSSPFSHPLNIPPPLCAHTNLKTDISLLCDLMYGSELHVGLSRTLRRFPQPM